MHPILSDRKRLTIYLALWMLVSLLFSFYFSNVLTVPFLPSALFIIPLMAVYSQVNLSAWYIVKTFSRRRYSLERVAGGITVSVLVISGLWTGISWGWGRVLERVLPVTIASIHEEALYWTIFISGIQLFLVSIAASYMIAAFERSRQTERDAYEMKILANSAELKALRMQINPHFLFNSLNSITALIAIDAERARAMCTQLAEFFRTSVRYGSRDHVTLKEELELLEQYLDIEHIRFDDRLKVTLHIEESILTQRVPPLLLQPIIENAIKYGVADSLHGGTITVLGERKNDRIFLTISNTVDQEHSSVKKGTGMGLQIVRKRLHTFFNGDGDLQTIQNDTSFQVILFFPAMEQGQ